MLKSDSLSCRSNESDQTVPASFTLNRNKVIKKRVKNHCNVKVNMKKIVKFQELLTHVQGKRAVQINTLIEACKFNR